MTDCTWYVVEVGYNTKKGFKRQACVERVPDGCSPPRRYFYGGAEVFVLSANACISEAVAKDVARAQNLNNRGLGICLHNSW